MEKFENVIQCAEQNDGPEAYECQYRLGESYYFGEGWFGAPDRDKGLKWLRLAASNGHEGAIDLLIAISKTEEIKNGADR